MAKPPDTLKSVADLTRNTKFRRWTRKLSRGDVVLHPAAGPAFTIWQNTYRLFPRYSLLTEEATLLAISHTPMLAKKVRDRWLVFGGFEAYIEIQELPTETDSVAVHLQEYSKISDRQVEGLSLVLQLDKYQTHSVDGAVAPEQLRRLVKSSCRKDIADLVLSADYNSQGKFAESIDVKEGQLKRQATRLSKLEIEPADFITELLAGERG